MTHSCGNQSYYTQKVLDVHKLAMHSAAAGFGRAFNYGAGANAAPPLARRRNPARFAALVN